VSARDAPAQPAEPSAAELLEALGKVIRATRRARGLSQEDFAERAQFDRTYPSLLERGQRDPRLSSLLRVCVALDCTLVDLLCAAHRTGGAGASPEAPPAGLPSAGPVAQPPPDAELVALVRSVATWPTAQRQVFTLRKVYDLAPLDIACRLNLTESEVEQALIQAVLACGRVRDSTSAVCGPAAGTGGAGAVAMPDEDGGA
jgi:DNA-binding Xre family transcriptional regulator